MTPNVNTNLKPLPNVEQNVWCNVASPGAILLTWIIIDPSMNK